MENNEKKNVSIKNPTCYYYDVIIKFKDFDSVNILLDEKTFENVWIYYVSLKTFIGAKHLRIMFDKVDGIIRDYRGTKYWVLFGLEKHDAIYDRIRYHFVSKNGVTYLFSYKYGKIKFDSDEDLPLEEILTLHIVIIRIRSVFNSNQNYYYYNISLEKHEINLAKLSWNICNKIF